MHVSGTVLCSSLNRSVHHPMIPSDKLPSDGLGGGLRLDLGIKKGSQNFAS